MKAGAVFQMTGQDRSCERYNFAKSRATKVHRLVLNLLVCLVWVFVAFAGWLLPTVPSHFVNLTFSRTLKRILNILLQPSSHHDIQHQYKSRHSQFLSVVKLSAAILSSFILSDALLTGYFECHYTKCCYADCHCNKFRYAECSYSQCCYDKQSYSKCCYAKCSFLSVIIPSVVMLDFMAPTLRTLRPTAHTIVKLRSLPHQVSML